MKFRTKYALIENRERTFTNCGSPYKTEYGYEIDKKTGVKSLIEKGKTNVYEYIQSFADSVDINILLQRFADGDVNVFNQRQGAYLDAREMPKTYAELYSMLNDCNNLFDALPANIREQFDNSAARFWSDYGTDSFYDKLGVVREVEKESEVNNNAESNE